MPAVTYNTLWLTDRSRYEVGTGRCGCQRYLRYHAGPTGYGFAHKGESVPLSTGSYTHKAIEPLAKILKQHDRLPTEDEIRDIIHRVRAAYDKRLTERGFRGGMFTGPIIDETIKEQSVLIGGMVWVFAVQLIPWLHANYRVLEVEEERLHFLSCTCGAGPLDVSEHMRRGCSGQALMLRTDILAQHRQGRHLAYFEVKTTGWDSDAWAEQWETKPQLGLGTLDLDKRYGQEVTELYIIALSKGSRKKDKNADGSALEGIRRQQSPLAYGYCRPGNPPLAKDEWLPAYEWLDAAGATKRASKAHRRQGIWHLDGSDWPVWAAYKGSDPDLRADEFWVRQLPQSVRDRICFVLGPMNRQDQQLESLRRSLAAEEASWQDRLWKLYELQQQHAWASVEFQHTLDALIPRSWNCRPFGKEHECEMADICFHRAGWEDPIGSGKYVPRLPHHQPETDQAVARGLLPEQADELDEDQS